MAKLVEIKSKKPKEEWAITISGETWQSPVSKTHTVSDDYMQPDSNHFKGLILVQALYKYGLMDDDDMDNNTDNVSQKLVDTFGITPSSNDDNTNAMLAEFVDTWIPHYDNGYRWDYPCEKIKVQITKDGRKYKINYTKKDVIDALKAFEFAK